MNARSLWRASRRGVSAALAQRLRFALMVGSAALLIAAAGLLLIGREHVDRVSGGYHGAEMIVFLEEGVDGAEMQRVKEMLASIGAVESVRYVSSEEAMRRSQALLGGDVLLEGVEPGFFPASFEVALVGGAADVADVHPLIGEVRQASGVDSVEFLGGWVDRIGGAVAGVRRSWELTTIAAVALALLLVVVLVRSAAFSRTTAAVMLTVGASRSLARVPGIAAGALFGTVSAVLAVGLMAMLFYYAGAPVEERLRALFDAPGMHFLATGEVVLLVSLCAAAGAVGGGLGVDRGLASAA